MKFSNLTIVFITSLLLYGCSKNDLETIKEENLQQTEVSTFNQTQKSRIFPENASSASYPELVSFNRSQSSEAGLVYEVLPGPAAINPAMSPTPFSNNINMTSGSYFYEVSNMTPEDSEDSKDAVKSVNIEFTGNDGTTFLIDEIRVIHKPLGTGDHTFFGGVGQNKVMHGNTGIGTPFMPKLLSYITLWGKTDLKNAATGEVVAPDRMIHIMTTTNVRDKDLNLTTAVEEDESDYNFRNVQTHVILPPQDMQGNFSPIPGTDHGFLHMMFEGVKLNEGQRDHRLAYEILPGPSAINPEISPTPFSNNFAIGAGYYNLHVRDITKGDSEDSKDAVLQFDLLYQRQNGETFTIENINVIHKAEGSGDHTFFGGVGQYKIMHGNTGIGTDLMPKLTSYITLWGTADLKDGNGNVLARNRMIHIMVTGRVRDENLNLLTSLDQDLSDLSPDMIETHIILPPQDMQGNMDPVPGTKYGFLHLMFESVELKR
ncbi:hypothetical protein C7S20_07290 [Christiangramia fulva]|uniref:Uncharacterized protein n=1 Tax=Christiangramia fulva TaxID=2126553 RepID=A0A2R3Z4D1_9FLAO|nr:hypothetical protein [Christiangramia fulva]AVR45088.1 hypothetical protein C7S20_07290 [Christiangramia fulva]